MTLRGSDELVGVVGLTPEKGADTAELGYWLSRSHWGRGITTEAASAVVSFGFEVSVCRTSRLATSKKIPRRAECLEARVRRDRSCHATVPGCRGQDAINTNAAAAPFLSRLSGD